MFLKILFKLHILQQTTQLCGIYDMFLKSQHYFGTRDKKMLSQLHWHIFKIIVIARITNLRF